jgi:hypothetical protein
LKKLMLMASMLAMVLLAASPVMAQATGGSGGDASDDSIGGAGGDATNAEYNLCQNIIGDITVGQYNDATNTAGDDVAVQGVDGDGNALSLSQDEAQAIAQENNTTIDIVQSCFSEGINTGEIVAGDDAVDVGPAAEDNNGDGVVDEADDVNNDGVVDEADTEASAEAGDAAASAEAGDAEAGAVAVLPDTGGASLFTLGAGALLVAGGLLARRIVR